MIKLNNHLVVYSYLQKIADDRWGDKKNYFVGEITIITDEIAIVKVTDREQKDMYFKIINGRPTSSYSPDKEIAILEALGEKHEGTNSQFAYYACRLLGKELPK